MREFFKPWRRKIGVVTLGLACVFMAGWVRNFFFYDLITIPRDGCIAKLNSVNGSVSLFVSLSTVDRHQFSDSELKWRVISTEEDAPRWKTNGTVFDTHGFLFAKGSKPLGGRYWAELSLPYWSVVLPLTLLSAWLLLVKPRPSDNPLPAEKPDT